MRTTLTIDDDLMLSIKRKAQDQHMSYKDVINSALREGIDLVGEKRPVSYTCRTFSLGMPREVNLNHGIDLFDTLQDEEIARKLQLKK